jgi:hypothetical protein
LDDRAVIERGRRQGVDQMPGGVGRQARPRVRRDQREVRRRQHPLPRVTGRVAARFELLEVRDLGDVDLGGEVPAGGRAEPLAGLEQAAGQRPGPVERRFRAPPQQHRQPLLPDLEHHPERLMPEAARRRARGLVIAHNLIVTGPGVQ